MGRFHPASGYPRSHLSLLLAQFSVQASSTFSIFALQSFRLALGYPALVIPLSSTGLAFVRRLVTMVGWFDSRSGLMLHCTLCLVLYW